MTIELKQDVIEKFVKCLKDMGFKKMENGEYETFEVYGIYENKYGHRIDIDKGDYELSITMSGKFFNFYVNKVEDVKLVIYEEMPGYFMKKHEDKHRKLLIQPLPGTTRLCDATGMMLDCEKCGSVDFKKNGEQYTCAGCGTVR